VIPVQLTETQLIFAVRVTPRGARDCVLPFEPGDEALRLKVAVPPEDGKANEAVLKLLADLLALPKSRLTLLSGQKSRHKRIAISLDTPEHSELLLQNLAALLKSKSP
jgi:uncharacterized protein (TIGR00251 family)